MQKKEDIITDIIIPRNLAVFLSLLLIFGLFVIALRYGGVLREDQLLFSGAIFLIFGVSLPFIPLYIFKDKFVFLILLFIFFSFFSLRKTPDVRSGLLDIVLILDFLFLYIIAKSLSAERKIRELLNMGIAISAVILVLFFLYLSKPLPMKGNFANPSHFSIFLSSCVPLLFLSRNSGKSILPWILSFVLLTGVFLSGAWGGITSLFISLIIYLFINRSRLMKKRWAYSILFILFLMSLSLFSVYRGIGSSFSLKGLISSVSSRLEMWWYGIKCSFKYFPSGSGIGSFRWVFPSCYKGDMKGEFPALHNEFLECLFTTGLFSFILLLIGVFFLFKDYISFSSSRKVFSGTRTGAFFALLTIMVHSLFDFPIHLPLLLFLSAVFLGVYRGEKVVAAGNSWKKKVFLLIPFLILFITFLFAWRDYRKIHNLKNAGKRIEMNLLSSPFIESSGMEELGELYYRLYKETEKEALLYVSFLFFERCVELNRWNYRCLYNLGVVSIEVGDMESAKDYLKSSISINPLNPMAKFLYGLILLEEGNEEGRSSILEAIRIAPELSKTAEKLLERK
jgi:hypothetical protein